MVRNQNESQPKLIERPTERPTEHPTERPTEHPTECTLAPIQGFHQLDVLFRTGSTDLGDRTAVGDEDIDLFEVGDAHGRRPF